MIYEGLFVSLQRPTKNNDPMKELYFADHGRNVAGLVLHQKGVTSVLVGASSTSQLEKNLKCVKAVPFDEAL